MAVNKAMKSFKQYITEKPAKLSATLSYKGAKWEDFRGLENPNEKELSNHLKKSKHNTLRFLVDAKGKMWAWDGGHALHDAVVFAMPGEKYNGNYAKGTIEFFDIENESGSAESGNLWVRVLNSRTVGVDFALKNRTLKSLAKRINSNDDERVYWSDY